MLRPRIPNPTKPKTELDASTGMLREALVLDSTAKERRGGESAGASVRGGEPTGTCDDFLGFFDGVGRISGSRASLGSDSRVVFRFVTGTFGIFSATFSADLTEIERLGGAFGVFAGVLVGLGDDGTLESDFKLSKSNSMSCFFGFGEAFFFCTVFGSKRAEKLAGFSINDSMSFIAWSKMSFGFPFGLNSSLNSANGLKLFSSIQP